MAQKCKASTLKGEAAGSRVQVIMEFKASFSYIGPRLQKGERSRRCSPVVAHLLNMHSTLALILRTTVWEAGGQRHPKLQR